MGDLVKLYKDYKDQADFLQVYVREAHPTDEWEMKKNLDENVCYPQPKTLEQRLAIANDFIKRFQFPLPFGIDDMNNAASDVYAAWPERIYIVDENGRLAYCGGMGPFHYKPEEARVWLEKRFGPVKQLEKPASTPSSAAPAPASPRPSSDTTRKS